MKRKGKKNKAKGERMAAEQPTTGGEHSRQSVWNFQPNSEEELISLDEYMEIMAMFLNGLYPKAGYRVTAMTYSAEAIYMKITKDVHTK